METEFFDRIKRLVILAMFSEPDLQGQLVLKGGNLIDIVFGVSTRSSVDVDFSISGEFQSPDGLRQKLENALVPVFHDVGYEVFDIKILERPKCLSDDMKHFWGGYQIDFKIIESDKGAQFGDDLDAMRRNATVIGDNSRRKFAIDISKYEFCEGKETTCLDGVTVWHYSPEMVVFEKIRAICQQMPEYLAAVGGAPSGRARDFIDIHAVSEDYMINYAATENHGLVGRIFAAKRVPMSLIKRLGDDEVREFHRPDFAAVRDTVKADLELEDFDYYVEYVVRRCRDLESLWDV